MEVAVGRLANIFNGLAPGTYDVRIRDAVNPACEIVLNPGVTITEPAILSAVVASTDVTCFGANNGIIKLQIRQEVMEHMNTA